MRQNIEAAQPLNPHGGITYAAVEIEAWRGKPLTLALGMRARSFQDQVKYWGLIRSAPLDEVEFCKQVGEDRIPLTHLEMKTQLEGKGYYPDLKSYRAELIHRLYGSESLFRENCRLLKMGKAYREIAAGTTDYHELFKKLLPEPNRELFEVVIRTLRELDESNRNLNGLEERQQYLESLAGLVDGIRERREAKLRYQWLIHHLKAEQHGRDQQNCLEQQQEKEQELAGCTAEIQTGKRQLDEYQRQLNSLRQQDKSGLLAMEQERKQEIERLKTDCDQLQQDVKDHTQTVTKVDREARDSLKDWRMSVRGFYTSLHRLRDKLPFAIGYLLADLDAQQRVEEIREAKDVIVDRTASDSQAALDQLTGEQSALKARQNNLNSEHEALEEQIATLEKEQELAPPVAGFSDACRALEEAMVQPAPLYRGLEWRPEILQATRAAIEETIGAEVLSILLVAGEDWEAASNSVLKEYPGIRLANRDEAAMDLPGWMRKNFDIQECDPGALRVLAEEMQAERHPAVDKVGSETVLRFRSHQRRLKGEQAFLIGAASRQDALKKKIRELEQKKKEIARDLREVTKRANELDDQRSSLNTLADMLRTSPREVINLRYQALSAQDRVEDAKHRLREKQSDLDIQTEHLSNRETELADIQARIKNERLDQLERRQKRVQKHIDQTQDQLDDLREKKGHIAGSIERLRQETAELTERIDKEYQKRAEFAEQLAPLAADVESVEYYVLRTWKGRQFTRIQNVEAVLSQADRDEALKTGELRTQLSHPTFGAQYSFTYDEPKNLLTDRHMSPIQEVVAGGRKEIEEQREVINQRTHELIKTIIMGDLFTELKRSVNILREMARKINHLLRERDFGGNRYRFNLEVQPGYRDLLTVIEQYNPMDSRAQEELKHFLELHKDEIMHTDVNDIPEILDYRNWFEYVLNMTRQVESDGVKIDKHTKSLGSGGEQAVPNYLLILMVAHFLYDGNSALKARVLLFDEAFYGIDSGRRDQLLGFASDLKLQLFVASPDLDGVKQEIPYSTTLLIIKDTDCHVHLMKCDFSSRYQLDMLDTDADLSAPDFKPTEGNDHA